MIIITILIIIILYLLSNFNNMIINLDDKYNKKINELDYYIKVLENKLNYRNKEIDNNINNKIKQIDDLYNYKFKELNKKIEELNDKIKYIHLKFNNLCIVCYEKWFGKHNGHLILFNLLIMTDNICLLNYDNDNYCIIRKTYDNTNYNLFKSNIVNIKELKKAYDDYKKILNDLFDSNLNFQYKLLLEY